MKKPNPKVDIMLEQRKKFHQSLIDNKIITINESGIPSNASFKNPQSVEIAKSIAKQLKAQEAPRLTRNESKMRFNEAVAKFTENSLKAISDDIWTISHLGSKKLWNYAQYEHLGIINRDLLPYLGADYKISPDIVISRKTDISKSINTLRKQLNNRAKTNHKPVLHAAIFVDSDFRTEAINLINKRSGCCPKIVVVTIEPLPSNIVLETGEIDCVYHFALPELIRAVKQLDDIERFQELDSLVQSNRLKDISELPFDLLV